MKKLEVALLAQGMPVSLTKKPKVKIGNVMTLYHNNKVLVCISGSLYSIGSEYKIYSYSGLAICKEVKGD